MPGTAGLTVGGSARLPQRRRQPLLVAQAAAEDFAVPVAVANAENFCSTCFDPHSGQTSSPLLLPRISFSKTFPHF
jgi:hypothetical protein